MSVIFSQPIYGHLFSQFVLLLRPLAGAKYCNQFVHNVHNVLNLHWPSLLAGKWPDRHQTCTRWSPGKSASTVCSRSRSRSRSKSRDTGTFVLARKIASSCRIIGLRGIIHYSRQVCNLLLLAFQYISPGGSTTAAKSAIYDCLVHVWNRLPLHIVAVNNATSFVRGLDSLSAKFFSTRSWTSYCSFVGYIRVYFFFFCRGLL